jgi:enoyl-CoA hydratase/carnithine racemase
MEAEPINTKKLGRIGVITLNRPEARNTFTVPFAEQLDQGQRQTFFHRDLS